MLRLTALTACILALSLTAQDAPKKPMGRRAFYPPEHTLAAFIDVSLIQDTQVWGAIERSPARILFEQFRRNFGFDLSEVDRFDFRMTLNPNAKNHREQSSVVVALTGTDQVNFDKVDLEKLHRQDKQETIGGHEFIGGSEPALISPSKGLAIFTDSHHLIAVLSGQLKSSVPTPELMPLMAGPKALAWFATTRIDDEVQGRRGFDLPSSMQSDTDLWTSLSAKITQDKATSHFKLNAQVSFTNGSESPAIFRDGFYQMIEKLKSSPASKPLSSTLSNIALETKGKTITLAVDLGPEKGLARTVTSLAVLIATDVFRVRQVGGQRNAPGAPVLVDHEHAHPADGPPKPTEKAKPAQPSSKPTKKK